MKVVAVNGSPRKNNNTATLLKHAVSGAESAGAKAETFHLYDYKYSGCISCYFCKLKDTAGSGICALNDDLTHILELIMDADVLLLGSPIYFNEISGMMRSFYERLAFMNITYDDPYRKAPGKNISSAFFFTMNMPKEGKKHYAPMFDMCSKGLGILGGTTEYMASYDTMQFEDYSKYAAGVFDMKHKEKTRAKQWPLDCEKAFEIGKRLASQKTGS